MSAATCGHEPLGGTRCGEPATNHFLVPPGVGAPVWTAILSCPAHETKARSYSVDEHTVGPVCPSDKALWVNRRPQGESFCTHPEDDQTIHQAVSEPARVLERSAR